MAEWVSRGCGCGVAGGVARCPRLKVFVERAAASFAFTKG
jgi:hypothetical protein